MRKIRIIVRNLFQLSAVIYLLSLGFVSCGNSNTKYVSNETTSRVYSLELSSSMPKISDIVSINLEFRPATQKPVDFNPDNSFSPASISQKFTLVLKFPRGLNYLTDSSLLKDEYLLGDTFGAAPVRNPNSVGQCLNGTTYLQYTFEERELSANEPLVAALRLKAVATERNPVGVLGVATASDFPDYCSVNFEKKLNLDIE